MRNKKFLPPADFSRAQHDHKWASCHLGPFECEIVTFQMFAPKHLTVNNATQPSVYHQRSFKDVHMPYFSHLFHLVFLALEIFSILLISSLTF